MTIEQAALLQPHYIPNEAVAKELHNKNIVMFVAPATTGKTSLMNNIATQYKSFCRVPVFTTREARADDDPGMFRVLPHDDKHITAILSKIERREVVQYVVHPSGRFYGSETKDYPGEYNMLATLSGAVGQLRQLPFKCCFVIGVVTDATTWKGWFNKRFPLGHPERPKRLNEAVTSLKWLLTQESLIWANNRAGHLEETSRSIVDTILYNKNSEDAAYLAKDMLRKAEGMMI